MAVTYTWKVTGVKVKDEGANQSAVVQTYWTKTGTDEAGHSGTFSGATPFTTQNMPAGSAFIPFDQLTEEVVLSWIQAVATGSYGEHIDGQIEKQISDKIRPVTEPSLPWAPTPIPQTP